MFVDLRALRHDRVTLVERGSPHSLSLMESGKLLPGVRTGNIFLFVQQLKILSSGERHHRGPRDPGPVRGQQPRGDLGGGRHHAALSTVLIICNPATECLSELISLSDLMTSSHHIHKSVCSQCPHNASGYYTVFSETDSSYADHFAAR